MEIPVQGPSGPAASPGVRKVIGPMAGERSGLSLIHAVVVDVSKRWRGIKLTPGDLQKLNALRSQVAPLPATG